MNIKQVTTRVKISNEKISNHICRRHSLEKVLRKEEAELLNMEAYFLQGKEKLPVHLERGSECHLTTWSSFHCSMEAAFTGIPQNPEHCLGPDLSFTAQ